MLRNDQAVVDSKAITQKDIRGALQFLQTPVAEELFTNLLEYLHSGAGQSPDGEVSKLQVPTPSPAMQLIRNPPLPPRPSCHTGCLDRRPAAREALGRRPAF